MRKMMYWALAAVMMIFAIDAMAQPRQGGFGGPQFSPEQYAERQTDRMSRELDLSTRQYKQVYRLQLDQAKRMQRDFRAYRDMGDSREMMRRKMMEERRKMAAQYQRILSREQYLRWERMMQRDAERFRGKAPVKGGGHYAPRPGGKGPQMKHDTGGKWSDKAPHAHQGRR